MDNSTGVRPIQPIVVLSNHMTEGFAVYIASLLDIVVAPTRTDVELQQNSEAIDAITNRMRADRVLREK